MPPEGSGYGGARNHFHQTLTDAINDIIVAGYNSIERVESWLKKIREAAVESLTPPSVLQDALAATLRAIYRSKVERGSILQFHPSLPRFTLEQVKPKLRAELDRRIMTSVGLIRLNREKMVSDTVQRLAGFLTSIPPGGSDAVNRAEVKEAIRKPLGSLPFLERRVIVDQSHKLVANLNNILAEDSGAIALMWRSHWRQRNYDYREDHKERDGRVYLIRDSWAQQQGLVRANDNGYYDEITAVGEEVYCRCFAVYIYSLGRLPDNMLTVKGREELARVKLAA